MRNYDISYRCGHQENIILDSPQEEHYWRLVPLEEQDCPRCREERTIIGYVRAVGGQSSRWAPGPREGFEPVSAIFPDGWREAAPSGKFAPPAGCRRIYPPKQKSQSGAPAATPEPRLILAPQCEDDWSLCWMPSCQRWGMGWGVAPMAPFICIAGWPHDDAAIAWEKLGKYLAQHPEDFRQLVEDGCILANRPDDIEAAEAALRMQL